MYEIGGLIISGILAQWLAWRLRVPAILPLILLGLCAGPVAEYLLGYRFIYPRFDADSGFGLFPGNLLYSFVSLSIGLILFEGGLTLKRKELRGLGPSILRLATVGALTTAVLAALVCHFLLGIGWRISFLISSLIVVTGPTVITPILRNIHIKQNVATVLKWESIVIDPIGAFMAVLVFNFILSSYAGGESTADAILDFVRSFLVGSALGVILGYLLYLLIKNLFVPKYLLNVFTLALVIGAFLLSDLIAHESGLLTAVVMGATLANLDVPHLHDILDFKESLTLLLISLLFILLSANMTVAQLTLIVRPDVLLFFLLVILVIRPLSVFWSLHRTDLTWQDKAFVSWVGPRGIVAAGVASLFGIQMQEMGIPGAEIITPLVFTVVLGTVLLNGTLAGLVGRWLGVVLPEGSGVLIYGSSEGALLLARCLQNSGRQVVVATASQGDIEEAAELGLDTIRSTLLVDTLDEETSLVDIGYVLALTGSDEDNQYIINRYGDTLGARGAYRLLTKKETVGGQRPAAVALFSPIASYLVFNRTARQASEVQQLVLASPASLPTALAQLRHEKQIPLYIKHAKDGSIHFLTADEQLPEVAAGDTMYYLGETAAIPVPVPVNLGQVSLVEG